MSKKELKMKLICCESVSKSLTVFWNPFNKVIQCHSCGHVYVPATEENYKEIKEILDNEKKK